MLKISKTVIDVGIPPAVKSIPCLVPQIILDVMNATADSTLNEFGLFLRYKFKDGKIVISKKFNIPEQLVSPGYISFITEPGPKDNAVIHRHPEGALNFSNIDDNSINIDFRVSLLFVRSKGIFKGIYTHTHKGLDISTPLDIKIIPNAKVKAITDVLLSSCTQFKVETPRLSDMHIPYGNFGNYRGFARRRLSRGEIDESLLDTLNELQ